MKHAPTPIDLLEPRIAPATFLVTSLADAGAGSLREAIAAANDAPSRDLIVFEKGLTGVIALTTGEIAIKGALAIKGPGAANLAIDGQGASRIFNVSDGDGATDSPLGISGLAFFDGNSANGGGAIQSVESLKITACVFRDNVANLQGGGAILVGGPSASLDVRDSIFTGNHSNARGGAISAGVMGSVIVKNCAFHHNSAQTSAGAVELAAGPEKLLLVEKCQFLTNRAGFSGAANLSGGFFDPLRPSKIVVRGSLFQGNQALDLSIGAVQIDGGQALFERNVVSQNTAARDGGGLVASNVDSLKIKASRFLDNSAGANFNGGGLFIGREVLPDRTVEIIGCIISGNSAREGGGIATGENDFTLKIIGTTLANNHSQARGGGLFIDADLNTQVGASVEIVGSTITGNIAFAGDGGGVAAFGSGDLSIKSSKITLNTTDAGDGGGLFLDRENPTRIVASLIGQNAAELSGGGIFALSALDLRGTKIIGNSAALEFGGGINSGAALNLAGCIVTGNVASKGGAIFHVSISALTLTSTKVAGNVSEDGEQVVDL
jgi:predicted outer membrane repeat protein